MDDGGCNVIRLWLDREDIGASQRNLLQLHIDLIESGGPAMVPGCCIALENDFHRLNIRARKGATPMTPVFCYGPFTESELGFAHPAWPISRI